MVNIPYTVINMDVWKAVIRVSLYLALGDSITAGYGVGSLFSFPTVYGNFLRRHSPDLSVHNLGVNGLTTHGTNPSHSHLDEQTQHFMVMVSASLIDYTVDASNRQISGDDKNRLYYIEFWEFVWQDDRWVLANIYQEDALEVAKIARGEEK
ncbi:MAG TPA: SGNH/GDSL hydrolase family protein [Desulfosporosinus sp.]|nr:SGNH/GDSL hydrolase family protein [Desulfosporosinus sp.]